MKMLEVLKEKMNKFLKEIQENTNKKWRRLITPFRKLRKKNTSKQLKESNKTVLELKMETESIKKS